MAKVGRVSADYDPHADVLYLALDMPRPAEGEETPDGLVLRYDAETDEPCGVTALRLGSWKDHQDQLSRRVGEFLGVPPPDVRSALLKLEPR
jgi:hypothetical protein